MSHEFRTPLNGVIGMARLLEGTRLTAEQRAYVAALTESGEHLLGLVNDVLDYAKLGAARLPLSLSAVAPEELLRQVCELLSPRAHEKGVEIGWAAAPGIGPVLADEGRVRQILLNLAGNAVKFVDSGGVLMRAEPAPSGGLRFIVSDTGPGVPEELAQSIFEAFAQGDPTQSGAGLGLAIARRLAEAMDGELGLARRAGGDALGQRGADFWFEAIFAAAPATSMACADLAGRSVAIASPSAIVREAAARQIEASGGRAVRAATLREALAGADEGAVVLVDQLLAGPRRALAAPPGRAAVVLLRPDERDRIAACRTAGFAGYLIKPLRRASLVQRVLAAGGEAQAPEDERIVQRREAAAPAALGLRVLLAEDNPINAMLALALLRREGAAVRHVESGGAALSALAGEAFDLLLMDVRMPGLSGVEATRALRARGIATPVVALTANAFEDDRRECLAAGMDDFLVKPLQPEALRVALARWTGSRWTPAASRDKVAASSRIAARRGGLER